MSSKPWLLAGLFACATACSSADDNTEQLTDSKNKLLYTSGTAWQTPYIPVCWVNPQDGAAMNWVRDALVQTWERVAAIRFTGWGACASDSKSVRIFVDDSNPRSNIGSHIEGAPITMWLNFSFATWSPVCQSSREFCIRSIAVHEFGHVLGFDHEQNRADTPANCPRDGIIAGDTPIGLWDPHSVMNYCNVNWVNAGVLSDGDIAGVRAVYGTALADPLDGRAFIAPQYESFYGDLSAAFGGDMNAVTSHWLNNGRDEGRQSSLVFSSAFYLGGYGDLRAAFGTQNYRAAIDHYVRAGIYEGRRGSILFDPRYYLAKYGDLSAAFGADYNAATIHYLQNGINEGRQASPDFDPVYYLATYPDLTAAFGPTGYAAGAAHYLSNGRSEGRRGAP